MTTPQPMETAPTDGTRVLINTRVYHFSAEKMRHVPGGTQWIECRFIEGRWREWCGNERTQSTGSIDPIEWAPVPGAALKPTQSGASESVCNCPKIGERFTPEKHRGACPVHHIDRAKPGVSE